jgi:hypothetical protein
MAKSETEKCTETTCSFKKSNPECNACYVWFRLREVL